MKTQNVISILFLFQFCILSAQNPNLDDFKIGMFGFEAKKVNNVYVSQAMMGGYRTSNLNTFSDDGFNIIMSYKPDFYTYDNDDVLNINLLAKDNNMLIANRAIWWVRPGHENVYDEPSGDRDHPNYEFLFENVYDRSDLNGWIWGHQLTEEASYMHPFNPYDNMGPVYYPTWHTDTYDDNSGLYGWIPDNFVMTEVPVDDVDQAIDDFQFFMSDNNITNQKLFLMEANHQRSIHDDTDDGPGDSNPNDNHNPQDYIKLLQNEPGTVFFEGSYQQYHTSKWDNDEYLYSNISNNGPESNFHFLSKFKNIDYAYNYTDEVHSVVSSSLADPSIHYNHFHSDLSIENANWMWFKAYTSIIHGAAGIWFWSYGQSYDNTKSIDITNKAIYQNSSLDYRFDPSYCLRIPVIPCQ